jgi:spore coat protein U-like protein
MKRIAVFGALIGAALIPCAVSAANGTSNLSVSAQVTANCTIATTPLTFAGYDPVGTNATNNLDGQGKVTVACTKGHSANIGLGNGSNGRKLSDGNGNLLSYEMYSDSNRSAAWTSQGISTGAAISKTARDFTVYGRIPSNQDVPAGNYSDTVVATVNF